MMADGTGGVSSIRTNGRGSSWALAASAAMSSVTTVRDAVLISDAL